jgi:hypothetical protein
MLYVEDRLLIAIATGSLILCCSDRHLRMVGTVHFQVRRGSAMRGAQRHQQGNQEGDGCL